MMTVNAARDNSEYLYRLKEIPVKLNIARLAGAGSRYEPIPGPAENFNESEDKKKVHVLRGEYMHQLISF
ncbi:MAG: hypothetical protein U1F76_16240 [Candidatus Competibacteraceae bacterium]